MTVSELLKYYDGRNIRFYEQNQSGEWMDIFDCYQGSSEGVFKYGKRKIISFAIEINHKISSGRLFYYPELRVYISNESMRE